MKYNLLLRILVNVDSSCSLWCHKAEEEVMHTTFKAETLEKWLEVSHTAKAQASTSKYLDLEKKWVSNCLIEFLVFLKIWIFYCTNRFWFYVLQ